MGMVCIALYRPRAGKEEAVRELLARHVATLRREGLATNRPALLLRGKDGTYLELFEWASEAAMRSAHANEAVAAIWGPFGEAAEFRHLADLTEANQPFPDFEAIDGITE